VYIDTLGAPVDAAKDEKETMVKKKERARRKGWRDRTKTMATQ
jgi:hypothetical protein